jgi:hypothetical protein
MENKTEWRVTLQGQTDSILEMIRNRNNPNYKRLSPAPYTSSSSFAVKEDALEYAYMVRLHGGECSIYNYNGDRYDE